MVDLYRLFKVDTRTLTNQQHKFAGQVGDAISTRIHFTYEPENILEENDYTPYIMFNIMDCKGRPYVYSPHSKHPFDGYTFAIPWEITSKIKNNRLEYQLLLVRSDIAFDGNILSLGDTEYLLSNMDGIAYKHSVKVSNCGCGGLNPGMEPSLLGWINFWKEHGLIEPVEYERKASGDGGRLVFRTVGKEPFYVDIPDKGANDGKTIFKVNGEEIGFTTANQSKNKEIDIPVPKVNNPRIRFLQNGKVVATITLNQSKDQDIDLGGPPQPTHEEVEQSVSEIGSPTEKDYLITHTLDSMDLSAKIRYTNPMNEGYPFIKARVYAVDYSHARVSFNRPPDTDGKYTVILTTCKVKNGLSGIVFGNTTDKDYTISHSLDTMDLLAVVRKRGQSSKGFEYVDAKISAIDNNRVHVRLAHPSEVDDAYVLVLISGTLLETSSSSVFGNTFDKEYVIWHNLGTLDIDYSIRRNIASQYGYDYVDAKVIALDNERVKVILKNVPKENDGFTFFAVRKDEI